MSIELANESGYVLDEDHVVRVARHALDTMGVSPLAELSVLLVDETEMERLHVQYMDLPGPTDVLSFPMDELDLRGSRGATHAHEDVTEDMSPVLVGDIVLCPTVAERQAVEAGHSTTAELELLTTHGVLHLLGFDHAEPDEKAEMFGLQGEILAAWRARTAP